MKWYEYWIVVVGVLTACSLAHDVIKALRTGVFEEVLKDPVDPVHKFV